MPSRSFAERYARDRAWRVRRARLVGLTLLTVLLLGWALFAVVAIRALRPGGGQELGGVVPGDLPPQQAAKEKEPGEGNKKVWSWEDEEWELDPRTELRVPKFWAPKEGTKDEDLWKSTERDARGDPTIFLMIASYRDFQCRETVTSALTRASKPGRLRISVVEQNVEDDVACDLPLQGPCSENANQPICIYGSNLHIYKMDARRATGPVYARHVGTRLYRGEAFAMQVDAHVTFTRGWDESLLEQWASAKNEMAVLSTYLTDVQNSIDANGDSLRVTRPIMCNSAFEGRMPARYLRHGAQPEEKPEIIGEPMLHPFWAAGMSFSRGHFVYKVPYDCCLPFVFMGEEISIGIRAWTHGYDLYATEKSVVFHEYAQKSPRRRKVHTFWENKAAQHNIGQLALKRLTALIGMAPDVTDFDKTDAEKYGLGSTRDVSLFYKLFLVDVHTRQSTQLCKFVKTGVMTRAFKPFLRPNRLGIDYSRLQNYDTRAAIQAELDANWRPHARKACTRALEMNEVGWLRNAIDIAERAELKGDADPEHLLDRAKAALAALQKRPH